MIQYKFIKAGINIVCGLGMLFFSACHNEIQTTVLSTHQDTIKSDIAQKIGAVDNGKSVEKSINIVQSVDEQKPAFSSLLKGKKQQLVFRLNIMGCSTCTDSAYHLLQTEFSNSALFKDLIVLTNFSIKKQALVWRLNYPDFRNVYFLPEHIGDLFAEQTDNSYFYLMDVKSSTVSNIYFPDKSKMPETQAYLKKIEAAVER